MHPDPAQSVDPEPGSSSRLVARQPRTRRIVSPLAQLTRGPTRVTRPSSSGPEPIPLGSYGQDIDMGGPCSFYSTNQAFPPIFQGVPTRPSSSEPELISLGSDGLPMDGPPSYSTNRAFASMFQGARQISMSGSPQFFNIGVQNVNDNDNYGLSNINAFVSFDAVHDSSAQDPERRCHPGTRENVLKQMRYWIDNPDVEERILWLHGPAGVGKSAIAQTISHSYGRDKAAATFFFFRSDSSRNDGNRLFTTLAWQLAISIPGFRHRLTHSLKENPDTPRKAVEVQFEKLIAQPLRAMAGDMAQATSQMVIVIDGVDECSDEKLQKRLLAIIGNAVAGNGFPLRFLISSRPEAHIHDCFSKSRCPTLQIDLADLNEAYNDIEVYLRAEFTRIADEQQLDPESWPGDTVIENLICKSSGQFVYASTVVKFVGDEYNSAVTQLDIITELRPGDRDTAFADLDALYMDILQRQPKQEFMKDFLAILIARSKFPGDDLYKDDSLLLNVDEVELCRKLRGMRSLLKFRPRITAYHRSFLDFLDNPSRSRQYCIRRQGAMCRYLEFIVDAVVRFANNSLVNHGTKHFTPEFSFAAAHSYKFSLPLEVLEEVLLPLVSLRDTFVHSSEFVSGWKRGSCEECRMFDVIESLLLYLTLVRRSPLSSGTKSAVEMKATVNKGSIYLLSLQNLTQPDISLGSTDLTASMQLFGRESDEALSLLIAELKNIETSLSLNKAAIDLLEVVLLSDYASTVSKLPSLSDAQNLVDFIFYLANDKGLLRQCRPNTARKLILFALEIYAMIPLVPLPLVVHKEKAGHVPSVFQFPVKKICQYAFIWSLLSHDNIAAARRISVIQDGFTVVSSCEKKCSLKQWRQESRPSTAEVLQRVIEVAKAVQYLLSMGMMFDISRHDILLDSNSCTKVGPLILYFWPDNNPPYDFVVYNFGRIFYEVYFDIGVPYSDPDSAFLNQPSEPKIHDECWNLIQRCCAEDPKIRPTMDEVVAEMESRRAVWIS